MKCSLFDHHAKHGHQFDSNAKGGHDSKAKLLPHKLFGAPPYSDIYMTSNGIGSLMPENKKAGQVHSGHVAGHINKGGPKAYDNGHQAYDEDVDAEADQFIKHEHEKFSKFASVKIG